MDFARCSPELSSLGTAIQWSLSACVGSCKLFDCALHALLKATEK